MLLRLLLLPRGRLCLEKHEFGSHFDSQSENGKAKGKEEINKCDKELNGEIPGLLGASRQLLAALEGLQ
eukprot:2232677-Pyramimonas_sp.AAC.1